MRSHLKYIEDLAAQAISHVDFKELPVPVNEIASAFHLEVVYFPFHDKLSGLLKKEEAVIGVNESHHPLRQRFTVAHELGHFLLGHGLGEDNRDAIDEAFDSPRPQEREANFFASCLLMPGDWVKKQVKKDGLDIEKLSKTFGVSRQAITIRLLELRLIK